MTLWEIIKGCVKVVLGFTGVVSLLIACIITLAFLVWALKWEFAAFFEIDIFKKLQVPFKKKAEKIHMRLLERKAEK